MTKASKILVRGVAAIGLVAVLGGPSQGSRRPPLAATAMVQAAAAQRKVPAARPTRSECEELGFKVALAKARLEARTMRESGRDELSENLSDIYGNPDSITARYTERDGCVVTAQLSVERLRKLARGM